MGGGESSEAGGLTTASTSEWIMIHDPISDAIDIAPCIHNDEANKHFGEM